MEGKHTVDRRVLPASVRVTRSRCQARATRMWTEPLRTRGFTSKNLGQQKEMRLRPDSTTA